MASPSPRLLALLGLLAVAGYQNRDKLQGMLGNLTGQGGRTGAGGTGTSSAGGTGTSSAGGGGFLENLGGLLGGGAAGGGISGALNDLLGQFSQHGHGDTARSWVETGPNRSVDDDQLEEALGEDTIRDLTKKTGLSRQEILSRLSSVLPEAVDTLTPQGRLPTREEETRWASAARM
jgi:uncharacterized protein YidB (DUF937 family)